MADEKCSKKMQREFEEISKLKGQMIRELKCLEDSGADEFHIIKAMIIFDKMTTLAEWYSFHLSLRTKDAKEMYEENKELKALLGSENEETEEKEEES